MPILDEEWSWKTLTLSTFVKEKNYPLEWEEFFQQPRIQEIIEDISSVLCEEKSEIYPPMDKVFRALSLPLKKIRVVILGQDPYHNAGSAVGYCFSVPKNMSMNPSLKNIYTEIKNEGIKTEETGDLEKWVKQGCMMLNCSLTVEKGKPNSHSLLWKEFTDELIKYIVQHTENVAWLLMGKFAIDKGELVTKKSHRKFMTSHPSPFSAHKGYRDVPAFLGSGVFKKINEFLKEKIAW